MNKLLYTIIFLSTMSYGQTMDEVYDDIMSKDIHHKEYVMAQCMLETGWLKCNYCCLDKNNVFGWSYDGTHSIQFRSWQESVDHMIKWQTRANIKSNESYPDLLKRCWHAPNMDKYILKVEWCKRELKRRGY